MSGLLDFGHVFARKTGRAALAALAVTLGLASGCRDEGGPAVPESYRLRVERVVGPERGTDGALVRDGLDAALSGSRWFRRDDGPELSAEVRYAALAAADGVPVLRVEVDVDPPAEARLATELSATVELARSEGTIEMQRDLPVALERAVAVLDAHITLARGEDEARAALLADPDDEIVLLGLDWVEAHRARELADAVAVLADHPSERVALRAVECIGVVGGPEHARILVRRPRVGDAAHANRLYETLANLGGDHAIGFLEFAARNEEDPDLAKLAQRALARIRAAPLQGGDRPGADGTVRGHRGAGEGT